MIGTKTVSDLICAPEMLRKGKINIIDANVSAGKTYFALTTLPKWVSSPERILYLIDTSNGELRLQRNILTVSRQTYELCDYNTKHVWGENEAKDRMPVMTYSGFGSEVRKNNGHFNWSDFDYIVCDEMQNLVNYQKLPSGSADLEIAEAALRAVAAEGKATIVALSATPQKIREHFGELCYEVPFDRSELLRLETFHEIPYSQERVEDILMRHKGQTGILFVIDIATMKRYIEFANEHGIRANGIWSPHADKKMDDAQLALQRTILEKETIPANIDLLVINKASETSIKIQSEKRKVDYMIVHYNDEEVTTQVRGRYHGDLPYFYYHNTVAANREKINKTVLPNNFLNTRLYREKWPELCSMIDLHRPHGGSYSMPTVVKYLREGGYRVEKKKDSSRNGQYYYVISLR